jgi:hypothetical protein
MTWTTSRSCARLARGPPRAWPSAPSAPPLTRARARASDDDVRRADRSEIKGNVALASLPTSLARLSNLE